VAAPAGGGSLVLDAVEVVREAASDGVMLTGICKLMDAAADTDDATTGAEAEQGRQWTRAQRMQGEPRRRRMAAAAMRQKAALGVGAAQRAAGGEPAVLLLAGGRGAAGGRGGQMAPGLVIVGGSGPLVRRIS